MRKTQILLEWLEANQPNRQYSLAEVKEFLSIDRLEWSEQNDVTFECLPYNIIDAIIEEMKASGEYYRLDNKIESFKSQFPEQSEKKTKSEKI